MSLDNATAVSGPHGRSPFAGLDLCLACGFTLLPDAHGPVFEQGLWDFSNVIGIASYVAPSMVRVHFDKILNPRWRAVAKEYAVALLAPQHDAVRALPHAYRKPRTVNTVVTRVRAVAEWLNWLTERGITSLGEVTEYHCAAHVADRARKLDRNGNDLGVQKGAAAHAAQAVMDLAVYRDLFSSDRYRQELRPLGGAPASVVAGIKGGGANTTPTVAHDLLQPLLAASLYLIETLGLHIHQEARAVNVRRAEEAEAFLDHTINPDHEAFRAVLRRYIEEGRPLDRCSASGRSTKITLGMHPDDPLLQVGLSRIAREAGYYRFRNQWLTALRSDFEAAVKRVGVEEPFARNAVLVARADGRGQSPWTLPLSARGVDQMADLLRYACLIAISATTGMRWSELRELAVGCRLPPREVAPGLLRYKLASKVIKNQPLGGRTDEWVVIRHAHDAASAAEELLDGAEAGTALFGRMGFSQAPKALRAWANGPAGQRLGLAAIPAGPVNARMLRRTLAVEIAYRPGGLWAAKVHLKHISVVTTEGYASRPGGAQGRFLAQVGEQEQERNLAIVAAEYERFKSGVMPSGPGAANLIEFLHTVDGKLGEAAGSAPNVVLSDRQVHTMMAKRARTLHLGPANYCWYADPANALCQKLAHRQAQAVQIDGPLFNLCDSARCPQATHSAEHRPVWARTVEQNRVFIGQIARGQMAERARLQVDLARAQRVLDEIDAAGTAAFQAADIDNEPASGR